MTEKTEVEEEVVIDDFDTCPECGATLVHFSGLESIREYLYCPVCLDKGYDYDGEVLFRLGG